MLCLCLKVPQSDHSNRLLNRLLPTPAARLFPGSVQAWPLTRFTAVHCMCPKRMSSKVTVAKITLTVSTAVNNRPGLERGAEFYLFF